MTKKHYVAISKIIKEKAQTIEKKDGSIMHVVPLGALTYELASYFKSENALFDHARFMDACGIIE